MTLSLLLLALAVPAQSTGYLPPSSPSESTCRDTNDAGRRLVACKAASLEAVLNTLNVLEPKWRWALVQSAENWRCVMTGKFHADDLQEIFEFLHDWGIEAIVTEDSLEIDLRPAKPCLNIAAPGQDPKDCQYHSVPSEGDEVVCRDARLDKVVEAVNRVSEWKIVLPDIQPKAWHRYVGRLDTDARKLARLLLHAGFTMQREYDHKKIVVTHVPADALE